MPRPLKVYSWQATIFEDERVMLGDNVWITQASKIVAAPSMAAAARAAGVDRPSQLLNLGQTGNQIAVDTALADPGVVFVSTMQGGPERDTWHRSLRQGESG